jgi:2'-5' RNA ligase
MVQRNEHLVVIMLEKIAKGKEFEVWPMHITIVPWFPVDDESKLDQLLSKIAKKHKPLEVKAGQIEQWGGKDRFQVLKIDGDWRLLSLHWEVYKALEKNGFPIHQKDYLGEKYTPHVTLRNSLADEARYKDGEIINIDRFTLVKQLRLRGSGRMIKSLVKDYELAA